MIYEDLREIINHYISDYTHPEKRASTYIYKGEEKQIVRKAALTDLLSTICEKTYFKTPVIVNEAVNKNHLTANSVNSRSKIVIGLLRSELEPNLDWLVPDKKSRFFAVRRSERGYWIPKTVCLKSTCTRMITLWQICWARLRNLSEKRASRK